MPGAATIIAMVVAGGVAAALATQVPLILRRLPEPVATARRTGDDEAPVKETYAAIGRLRGVGVGCVVAAGLCGLVLGLLVGWQPVLPVWVYLAPVGVLLALIDWRTTYLPTRVIAPSYGVVVALLLLAAALDGDAHALLRAVLGWLVWGGLLFVLWFVHPRGTGYGDVRLAGLLGLPLGYLGWTPVLVGLYAGFVLAGVVGLVLRLRGVRRFALGPFLLLGALLGVVAGAVSGGLGGGLSG